MRLKVDQHCATVTVYCRLKEGDKFDRFLESLNDSNLLNSLSCVRKMAMATHKYYYITEFWIEELTQPSLVRQLSKVVRFLKKEYPKVHVDFDVFTTYETVR